MIQAVLIIRLIVNLTMAAGEAATRLREHCAAGNAEANDARRLAVFRVGDVHGGRWVNSVNRWIMAASKDGGRAVLQRHIPGIKKAEYLARPMITHG
eukprot:COSAG01_NODE_11308_length_1962_cov_1.494364_1_plen_97_part_00